MNRRKSLAELESDRERAEDRVTTADLNFNRACERARNARDEYDQKKAKERSATALRRLLNAEKNLKSIEDKIRNRIED